jgi:TRAP-type C4-dicarboxylate transport system permease small subunit
MSDAGSPEPAQPRLGPIEWAYDRFVTGLGILVGLSIGFFAVSIPIDLTLRLLHWGNIPWLSEFIEYCLYFGVFLAAPWVLRQNGHVRVDLVLSALPKRLSRRLERGLDVLGIVTCLALLWFGMLGMIEAYDSDSVRRATMVVYNWWLIALFNFTMVMLAIEFVFRLRHSAAELDRETDVTEKTGF